MKNSPKSDNQPVWENPIGTNGFAFIEFASLLPDRLEKKFIAMGFCPVAKHKTADITVYQQNDIYFIINASSSKKINDFAKIHGDSVSAMGFRVKNIASAEKEAVMRGARPYCPVSITEELNLPAIYGVGDSLIYFVDDDKKIEHDDQFHLLSPPLVTTSVNLNYIDHVTHNLFRGNMNSLATFYEHVFNFKETRYFDIEGKLTGLRSRAMTSPCGIIRIPLNESADDSSQIEEFLHAYNGEGIQHIALGSKNIYDSVEQLRASGVEFLNTPATYYEKINHRLPAHNEDLARLQKNHILIDGKQDSSDLLLQIFTKNMLGPIFFEIIQRKGDEGFGEGNFRALFESIEEDQIRRGVLTQ